MQLYNVVWMLIRQCCIVEDTRDRRVYCGENQARVGDKAGPALAQQRPQPWCGRRVRAASDGGREVTSIRFPIPDSGSMYTGGVENGIDERDKIIMTVL